MNRNSPFPVLVALLCLAAAGGSPGRADDDAAPALAVIEGVVREVRTIDGVKHATVSVGSASGVKKGMNFVVTDASSGAELGSFKVVAVEEDAATGTLDGSRVKDIRPDSRVSIEVPG